MPPCPSCGAANDPRDRFCGQCGGALAPASLPPTIESAPPRQLALYVGIVALLLTIMWGSGLSARLAVQIRDEIIPSLRQVSPFGLIAAFDRGMCCTDFRRSGLAITRAEYNPIWEWSPVKVPVAFAYTISRSLAAGWPVWVLVFPPLGLGIAFVRRARLPIFDHPPATLLIGVPSLLLACGVVSWAVQLLLVFWVLPIVAQLLVWLGVVGALYAKWREISGLYDDLRTALRIAGEGSGLNHSAIRRAHR